MIKWLFVLSLVVPAHDWYPKNCCGVNDCAPVKCEDITEQSDGMLRYQQLFFRRDQQFPSQDPRCHVCSRVLSPYGGSKQPICIFYVQGS